MKRCPECRRDYVDDTLLYCLEDGVALVQGSVASSDEPPTAFLHETSQPNESATRAQIRTTEQTAVFPSGIRNEPTPNRLDKRLILAPVALAVIVLTGFFGYRYFNSSHSGQISSIAVLPFENTGGNADSEYLSDGLAESLIYRLSQIPELKVSPRSSVFRYKAQNADVERVGSELGVDAVMSGRVIRRGENLTISVDLVDVRNKKTIWGEQFERKMSDLLATQREIAAAITEKLQVRLSGEQSKGATKTYTNNNEAYQAYLKGRYYWNRRTAETIGKAIEELKSATDKDPNFALAFAGLADCYSLLPEYAGTPVSETIQKAKGFAERAIAIDDGLAEAHASMGQVNKFLRDWAGAEREYKRSIELDPKYATAYHWYSHLLRNLGRYDEAFEIINRGHEIDPLSSIISVNVSEVLEIRGDSLASVENSMKIIEIDPNFAYAYTKLGTSYIELGRADEGIANLEKGVELSNRAGWALTNLGYGYASLGKRTEAMAIAKELEERYEKRQSPGAFIAGVYAGLGDNDAAFSWLEKDLQEGQDLGFIKWRIAFESLRDDPRFKNLLKRMGLPE